MKLVRTFHPVGHGAFYTEQFYKNDVIKQEDCVFTAVYDCGSTSLFPNQLKGVINEVFKKGDKIDALFISHFHKDHVNGISYLLELCEVEKIIIPAYTQIQFSILYIHNAIDSGKIDNDANELINKVYFTEDYKDRIIRVGATNEGSKIEELNENSFDRITPISKVVGDIISGTYLRSDKVPYWVYIPYNLNQFGKDNIIKDFFEKKLGALSASGDVDKVELRKLLDDKTSFDEVRKQYADAIDKDPNQHSMTLYSGHVFIKNKPILCSECHHCCPCYDYLEYCDRCWIKEDCDCKPFLWCCRKPICCNFLYTGDFVATKENVKSLTDTYNIYFRMCKSIQVPHHGSGNVGVGNQFGSRLFKCCKSGVISTKIGQYPNLPSNDTILEMSNRHVVPLYVTTDEGTKREVEYIL